MRFTSLILAGVFAIVASAETSGSTATATATTSSVASATTTDAAQASITKCIAACSESDVTCRANCITVPAPSDQQANDTIACVAKCPQGNGTAADNTAYGNCVNGCIGQYFYTSTGAPAGASATGAAGGSGGSGSSASGSSGSSGTGTASSTSSTSTSKSNAAALQMGASAVGLVGFLAAFLAL